MLSYIEKKKIKKPHTKIDVLMGNQNFIQCNKHVVIITISRICH
jgi:hypothetical protein